MPKRVVRRVGRRGFVLIMLGWVFFASGFQLLQPDGPTPEVQRQGTRFLELLLPSTVWAALFLSAATVCFIGAWFKRIEVAAFFLSAFLWTWWGIGYAMAIHGSTHPVAILRGAITNFVIAGFVVIASTWREHGE